MNSGSLEIKEIGTVEEVRQGIIKISGLPNCLYGQVIEVGAGLKGMIIEFNKNSALGIVFGDERKVNVGDEVYGYDQSVSVSVGANFVGRIVDSLCQPIDNKGEIAATDVFPVFRPAPGVMDREPINEALQTGIKIVDLIISLGKGQRELIVGDRQTGKSSIALDAIINQKGKNVICIYCWIGGSHTAFTKKIQILQSKGAMQYTLAISASAGSSSAEQYICPYTAATVGEYFRDQGRDVLVVFDDLTKHAWVYRQMSLLLERAPGREAYPGDIFFLHSQLLERAGKLKSEIGGGSMTFLPIAETLQGDITGYVPSNLISITDGQIYLNSGLFQEGFKPAIDIELSVSRIGSRVQCQAMRSLSKGLRYTYVQYRLLSRLTRLRTKLSAGASRQLQRGVALYQILIQDNYNPVSMVEQIILFYAFDQKILETVNIEHVKKFKNNFFDFLSKKDFNLIEEINKIGDLPEEIKNKLNVAINEFFHKLRADLNDSSREIKTKS